MVLWLKPLFGDMIPISYSTPIQNIHIFYRFIQTKYYPEIKLHQLHISHNESLDLSQVKENDILNIFIDEPYAEKWITDYSFTQSSKYTFKHSCLTWYDGRWGDPYEDPSVLNRTSLTLHIHLREDTEELDPSKKTQFTLNYNFFKQMYPSSKEETKWFFTLEEACQYYRDDWNTKQNADSFTEKTMKHIIHLWNLYHDTNYHLIEKGRYYDY
jgi:hypothetical protein